MIRRVFLLAWLACGALTPATAAAEQLSVVNLGQPDAVSTTPQPPVAGIDRGPCERPYELAQTEGAPSTCAWPATGTPDWGPAVGVAAGDTLQLRFTPVATAVTVTSTTNQQPGLAAPDGTRIPNELWFGPVSATATVEPGTWTLTLPATPAPGRFCCADAGTFAVLATVAGQTRAYSLRLSTPRAEEFGLPCGGRFFTAPGVSGVSACQPPAGGKYFPPGPSIQPRPPTRPTPAPAVRKLELTIRQTRQLPGAVRITVRANRAGALVVRGRLGRRTYTTRRTVLRGMTAVMLRLPRWAHGRLALRLRLTAGTAQATVTKTKQLE